MTVIFSKKCEYGLQGTLYLAANTDKGPISSDEIAEVLQIPKEFVSKILQSLTKHDIIGSKKGKAGGFFLKKPANEVKLIDIVTAIDGTDIFESCVLGFPQCSPDHPCPVHDRWGTLRDEAFTMLSSETLDQLTEKTLSKIKSL
ncbi:MAG: Rrf2 family transcriptional regulator [Candidatus Marinimicrobia bacterium]|nr:Rrf2 family transcriptional regulator [Candidatus Neomarinimicrobiota bacterium]MCF7827514.1 Rrf2 family transcriptional regulator [Candidatus Neomarinimicrobiota bacterium]MCF7881624.1 Rrf2 family transcriptional regulator [Candidatus Neomarinimicrobiota bacterium]